MNFQPLAGGLQLSAKEGTKGVLNKFNLRLLDIPSSETISEDDPPSAFRRAITSERAS